MKPEDRPLIHLGIPLTNEQAETTNKVILTGLKNRVTDLKSNSIEELDNVLRAIITTPKVGIGETRFRLIYRSFPHGTII